MPHGESPARGINRDAMSIISDSNAAATTDSGDVIDFNQKFTDPWEGE